MRSVGRVSSAVLTAATSSDPKARVLAILIIIAGTAKSLTPPEWAPVAEAAETLILAVALALGSRKPAEPAAPSEK